MLEIFKLVWFLESTFIYPVFVKVTEETCICAYAEFLQILFPLQSLTVWLVRQHPHILKRISVYLNAHMHGK